MQILACEPDYTLGNIKVKQATLSKRRLLVPV